MPDFNQSSYLKFKRRLVTGFFLLIILLILSLAWKIYSSYQNDKKTARIQTKNFVQAMGAHVIGALQFVDLSLVNSAEAIKALSVDSAPSPEAIRQLLLTSGRLSDANFWVIFIDAQGRGVAASNNLPIGGVSYADRPYFSSHVNNAAGALFVGTPEIGRVSKRRVFFLSRRVTSATGKFLGVVASPVDASAFATVFTNALFQPALSITLAHTDGKIIARAPKFDESFASNIIGSKLFEKMALAPSGTYEAKSIVDGDTRIYSYKTIENMPLVVSVGMASESWTEGLIDDMLVAMVGLGIIIAVLFFSGNFALRSYQKLAESEGDQRRLTHALVGSEKRLRLITDAVPALISYVDHEQRYRFNNKAYYGLTGIEPSQIIGMTVREVFGEENYQLMSTQISAALAGEPVSFERKIAKNGKTTYFQCDYIPERGSSGQVTGFYVMAIDISERRLAEQRLAESEQRLAVLARTDTLTGLASRYQLNEKLADVVERQKRTGQPIAVLYLDIDHFKQINDSFGHATGDLILIEFAKRLTTTVRTTDIVARLAGDEFVIVLEGLHQRVDATEVAEKILQVMAAPFSCGALVQHVGTSIGIAYAQQPGETPEQLLDRADKGLYVAKSKGRGTFAEEVSLQL